MAPGKEEKEATPAWVEGFAKLPLRNPDDVSVRNLWQKRPSKTERPPLTKYKVSMFGESAVGKTTMLHRHTKGVFSDSLMCTVGFDFVTVMKEVDGADIAMKVWDTAGQERFRTLTLQHYRGAKGIIFVYSLGSKDSFARVKDWLKLVEQGGLSPYREVMFLVGNKCDLQGSDAEVDIGRAQEFAKEHHCQHFVTSAKTGEGLEELFKGMAEALKDSFGPHYVASPWVPSNGSAESTSTPKQQEAQRVARRPSVFQLGGDEGSAWSAKASCCSLL